MGAVYTGIFYKHCGANANWLPGTRNMHVAGIAVHLAAIAGATQLLPTDVVVNYLGLCGNFDITFAPCFAHFSAHVPRCVMYNIGSAALYSTSGPCLSGADWCL